MYIQGVLICIYRCPDMYIQDVLICIYRCPDMYMPKGNQIFREELLCLAFHCVIYIFKLYEVLYTIKHNFYFFL